MAPTDSLQMEHCPSSLSTFQGQRRVSCSTALGSGLSRAPRSCWTPAPSRAQAASLHQSCFLQRGPVLTSKVTFQLLWRSETNPAGFWPVWGLHGDLCLAPVPCSSSSSGGAGQGMRDSEMKWLRLSWIISSLE